MNNELFNAVCEGLHNGDTKTLEWYDMPLFLRGVIKGKEFYYLCVNFEKHIYLSFGINEKIKPNKDEVLSINSINALCFGSMLNADILESIVCIDAIDSKNNKIISHEELQLYIQPDCIRIKDSAIFQLLKNNQQSMTFNEGGEVSCESDWFCEEAKNLLFYYTADKEIFEKEYKPLKNKVIEEKKPFDGDFEEALSDLRTVIFHFSIDPVKKEITTKLNIKNKE